MSESYHDVTKLFVVIINLSILLIFDFYSGFPKETPKLKFQALFFFLVYNSSENYFVDAS